MSTFAGNEISREFMFNIAVDGENLTYTVILINLLYSFYSLHAGHGVNRIIITITIIIIIPNAIVISTEVNGLTLS